MRYYTLLSFFLFLSLLITQPVQAQTFDLRDGFVMHEDALRPCIVINVDPEVNTLKDAWQDYIKSNFDTKIRGRNILSAEEVNINQISSNTIDLYTMIEEDMNGSEMKVFVAKGYDIYIGPDEHSVEYAALKDVVTNFIKQTLPTYYSEMILETEERIEDLIKDGKDLEDDLEDDAKKIKELEEELAKTKEQLIENTAKLDEAREKLEIRIKKLERIRSELLNL